MSEWNMARRYHAAWSCLMMLLLAMPGVCHAAQTISGTSDVVTEGSLVYAYSVGGATTCKGVQFWATPVTPATFTNWVNGSVTNVIATGFSQGVTPTRSRGIFSIALGAGYTNVINGLAYSTIASPGVVQGSLTLRGLVPGRQYSAQFWANDSYAFFGTNRQVQISTLTNGVPIADALVFNESKVNNGVGQFAVMRFTATTNSQLFTLQSAGGGNANVMMGLSAFQVRDVTLVEDDPGAATVLLEAEYFSDKGGWKVDTQFVEQMGSFYLLAHNFGQPGTDAVTFSTFPLTGFYRVWVRTKNWVSGYTGTAAPGRFQVSVSGSTIAEVFGDAVDTWQWEDGGEVWIQSGSREISLKDLTGFEGRCDAIAFIKGSSQPPPNDESLKAWRLAALGESLTPGAIEQYDLVVVGGGMGGCATALSAARNGVRVALVQDRPVLGGNASQEIRVGTRGERRFGLIYEIDATDGFANGDEQTVARDVVRQNVLTNEPNLTLYMPYRAYQVGTNATRTITHVDIQQVGSPSRLRLTAPLFADCTGDAWIGYWAGADYVYGSEPQSAYNEPQARPIPGTTLGNSLLWSTLVHATQTFPFPSTLPWATAVAGTAKATSGDWNWEYGIPATLHTINDSEHIRDHLFRAIYGNYFNQRVADGHSRRYFQWMAYVAGKRESRRLLGDYIIKQQDLRDGIYFDDAVMTTDWGMDLHYETAVSYRSIYTKYSIKNGKVFFPYRVLYSRNVPNLFMAGRNISSTHVAMGSPRVMNTIAQMGVVVGMAAKMCIENGYLPRDIYRMTNRVFELQARLTGHWVNTSQVAYPSDPNSSMVNGLIVDNTNAVAIGAWTSSTSDSNYYGINYLHDGNAGKGTKRVAWTLNTGAGNYRVSLGSAKVINKASNAPVWVFTDYATTNSQTTQPVYINNGQPAANHSGGQILVGRIAQANHQRGLLQFQIPGYLTNALVQAVDVTLTIAERDAESAEDWIGVQGLTLHAITETFDSGSVTWSNRNATTAWSTLGGTYNATALSSITSPTFPADVVAGESFVFPRSIALRSLVTNNLNGTVNLMVRAPGLETTWTTTKLYRFATATMTIYYDLPVMPATTNVNQSTGEYWVDLGTYNTREEGVRIVVGNDGTATHVVADAVKAENMNTSLNTDLDGDGMADDWERYYFLVRNGAGLNPNDDADGDGRSNWLEFKTNTDPTDSNSKYDLRIALANPVQQVGEEGITIRWNSFNGLRYRFEACDNLPMGSFEPVSGMTGILATEPTNEVLIPFEKDKPSKFYRLVLE